jgi:DNA-binding XRE family transcriptional regulator
MLGEITMSNASISLETVKKSLMEDDQFKTEYDKLKPRYDAIAQIIKARQELRITQAELAQRVGTQKSNISRLESGNYNPSLDFLIRVSDALGKNLIVQLI